MKNKSLIAGIIALTIVCGVFFTSCTEPQEIEKTVLLEKRTYTGEDSLIDAYERTKTTDAHSGSYISRTDSTHPYGIGAFFTLNDTNLNKDIRVNINLWARANKIEPGYIFAVSVHDGDNVVVWQEMDIKKQIKATNTWTNVVDSLTISGSQFNKPGLILKTFLYNPNNATKSIVVDGDDLEVSIKTVQKVIEE